MHHSSTAALIAVAALACNDIRLEPPDTETEPLVVDGELSLQGEFCTSPAANIDFPVKIMFIVDGSGSQQFTDQNRQRVVAVEQTINQLIRNPSTFFKVITFNASVSATPTVNTGDVYSNDLNELLPALNNLAEADTLTDYQGALAVAFSEIRRDIRSVIEDDTRGPAELSRTKYINILITDGLPDPQCQAGIGNDTDPNFPDNINRLCEDNSFLACLLQAGICIDGTFCDEMNPCAEGGCPDQTTCNDGQCEFNDTLCFEQPDADELFGGIANAEIAAGNDYNQPYQILTKVEEIMELEEDFQIGEIQFNAGLVLDPLADPAIIEIFGDSSQAAPLLAQMADIGNGEFFQFYGGDAIDFSNLDFDSLRQGRVIRSFYAVNMASRYLTDGLDFDSDFDGLTDAQEFEIGSDPFRQDSDGDGYGDFIEFERRGFGMDFNDPCAPDVIDQPGSDASAIDACNEGDPSTWFNCFVQNAGGIRQYVDTDRDGLNDCEERALGTNTEVVDTDADGFTDLIDFRFGLDPVVWDVDRDIDQDGLSNGREIEWHLNPVVEQNERQSRDRYRYDRPELGVTIDGRECYSYDIRRLQLARTTKNFDLEDQGFTGVGWNEIRLFVLENLADDLSGVPLVRQACIRTRFVPPSLQIPASGLATINGRARPRDDTLSEVQQIDYVPEDAVSDFKYLPGNDPIFNDPDILGDLFNPGADCLVLEE
ncbi:MAG: VWA domain-containing protein [Myxococcota bacterium]